MGCAQSKIDNEESVSRCKERKNLMKEAVSVRNAFASAHSGYAVSLKDTGAALSDYAQGEVPPQAPEEAVPLDLPASERPPPPPPPPPPESSLPLPPPPLPDFSPMPPGPPLRRAETMPATLSHSEHGKGKMKGMTVDESGFDEEEEEMEEEKGGLQRRKKGEAVRAELPLRTTLNQTTPPEVREMAWDFFSMDNIHEIYLDGVEEEVEGYGEDISGNLDEKFNSVGEEIEFNTPEKQVKFEGIEEFKTPEETPAVATTEKHFLHSNTAPPVMGRLEVNAQNAVGKKSGVDLLKLLSEIDDLFLKAYQSAQEVSKMLEATRLHYHSNFADNRGHINHAERVMQVITWNKSLRGTPNGETKENIDMDDYETHATILDKLLAWEKKLYEEVKAGELMKIEYQRKVARLNKLKKRNAAPEQLEKAKAAVSHLHTQYIVDMQSLDSTITEVNDIRDKQLYPKLVSLVHGMTKMWESMCVHHESQLRIVTDLKSLDVSGFRIETSKHHHERTKQLATVIECWQSQFEKLVANQRQYIAALNSWLKLNLVPIESNWKEKVSSPPRNSNPPIQPLLRAWHDYLEKLPDEVAKSAISSFAAVIKTIILHQEEEMKLKEKYEETRKEYLRKKQAFEDWYQKYAQHRTPTDETDPDKVVDPNAKDPIAERQFAVETLKKRLEEEMEDYQKHSVQVREKSVGNLKLRLPELFRALSDYANACADAYGRLRLLTQPQQQQPDRSV